MLDFLSGAIMTACLACGVFFFKSWRIGKDRLFLWFALAFWVLAVERWMLVSVEPENEMRYSVYTFRLIAFAIIALAIIDKNRGGGHRPE
ncbi:MAG: hypothetical protein IT366_22115 [Candidatus Hydrogenedentes bacterium]|nr:hypothetical protein [Candidatus Hydrogenedentota bacterium]